MKTTLLIILVVLAAAIVGVFLLRRARKRRAESARQAVQDKAHEGFLRMESLTGTSPHPPAPPPSGKDADCGPMRVCEKGVCGDPKNFEEMLLGRERLQAAEGEAAPGP